jgi:hypothetical protein
VCSNLLRRVRVLSPAVSMALKGLKITSIESLFFSDKSTLCFLQFVFGNDYFAFVITHSSLIRSRKFYLCLLCYVVLYCVVLCCIMSNYVVLYYDVLFYTMLSYHILSYLILSYLILSYLILSYLILSYSSN